MAPCRPGFPAKRSRGGGRTYSGVCAAGQAVGKPVFEAHWAAFHRANIWNSLGFSTVFKAYWNTAMAKGATEMAAITRKREARKSLQQPGWITFEGGFAARPCVVQDMSSSGAKITIDDPNSLPGKLRLALSRDARTGRSCEVVWRRGKSVGVRFVR